MAYIRTGWNDESASFSYLPNEFQVALWSSSVGRRAQTYGKWLFLGFLTVLVFSAKFGQVKEWFIEKLHKIKRVSHVVVCQIFFILFYDRDWQEVVSRIMKNDHSLVFLDI